jgi:hypothetical protein
MGCMFFGGSVDRQLADSYLHQWASWSSDELGRLGCKSASWQKHVTHEHQPGWAEETPTIKPGPDWVMELVDLTVTRVANQSPAMGRVLKMKYFHHKPVSFEDLNSALLRFISAWYEISPEVA